MTAIWRVLALCTLLGVGGALVLGDRTLVWMHALTSFAEGKSTAAPMVCSFRARTGVPCVGCGGSRAFQLGARGALGSSFQANPLGAWAAASAWVLVIAAAASLLAGRARPLRVPLVTVALLTPLVLLAAVVSWLWRLPPGALTGP